MKKILIFVNSLSCGGAERTAVWLVNGLAERGYETGLITLFDQTQDFLVPDPRVERHCLGVAKPSLTTPKDYWTVCFSLRRLLKSQNAETLLALQTGAGILCRMASAGLPCRVVISERNYPGRKKISPLMGFLRKVLYRHADRVIAQTGKTKAWLEQHTGCKRVVVIPNAVRWPVPSLPPTLDPGLFLEPSDKCVLAVGRLHAQKGFDLLIRAFAECRKTFPDWKLVILGENGRGGESAQQRSVLEQMVTDFGCDGRVFLPGRAGNIMQWYERADLFVLSSRFEGFPNVLLEAMSAGCACIAFDCDTGPAEIIHPGHDGVLVSPESVEALSNALADLMAHPDKRRAFSEHAVTIPKRFDETAILTKWENTLFDFQGFVSVNDCKTLLS